MKKFLLTTAAILVLLLVCFAGYVQYQKWQASNTLIPEEATAVLKVDIYGILQSVAVDYLRHTKPGDNREGEDHHKPHGIGLKVPAAAFVYQIKGFVKTTVFTSLEISDDADFGWMIRNKLGMRINGKPGDKYGIAVSGDGRLTAVFSGKIAAFAYSRDTEKVAPVLHDIIAQKNVTAIRNSRFKQVLDMPGHLAYLDEENTATLNFMRGALKAEATLKMEGLPNLSKTAHEAFNAGSFVTLWLNADLRKMIAGKEFSIGRFKLQSDSLLHDYRDAAALEIGPAIIQKETVVTYGYNEDFIKEAKTQTRETTVPSIILSLRAAPGLREYLVRQQLIPRDSNTVSRDAFPLYQLYAINYGNGLVLSTRTARPPDAELRSSPDFLGVDIDFNKIGQSGLFPAATAPLQPLRMFTARGKRDRTGRAHITATLQFNEADRNALLLLLE